MSRGVMTIETGVSCNNNCIYCPQRALRRASDPGPDPDTAVLKQRILRAHEQGYDEIAFSGGEPTIRRDFINLLSYARTQGFDRISVTTNGRLFSYPDFAREAVGAGLTGVSFSLHGPDGQVHDRLVGVKGAFRQLLAGIRCIEAIRAENGGVPDTHTITLVVPENVNQLQETLRLAGKLGIRLHIVQPFIVSGEVLDHASRFLLSLDDLVKAIEAAAPVVRSHEGRIKPYNIAPCLLEHLGPVIEHQDTPLRTFKSFVPSPDRPEGRVAKGQFVRVEACRTCTYRCPGFRLEQMSPARMAEAILQTLSERFKSGMPGHTVTIDSLDLLGRKDLHRVLSGIRDMWNKKIRLLYGGMSRTPFAEFVQAAMKYGIDEFCLVTLPPMLRMPDRGVWLAGNLARIKEVFEVFKPAAGTLPALFMVPGMALAPEFRFEEDTCTDLIARLAGAGGKTLYIALPDRLDAHLPPFDEQFRKRLRDFLPRLVGAALGHGLDTRIVSVPGGPRLDLSSMGEDLAPIESWREGFLGHPFAGHEFGWVMWSHPGWVLDHVEENR
ncbi:MAG: radical SAM protein [Deltaproteobacteria bacterium]|nr:radical SAM protein [Deltaproteobacteria bacterium]